MRRESNLRELEDSFNGPAASGKDIATIAKALAHPARIHIVRLLMEKQSCIGCDIVDEVGLAQSTVSEHLRILKAAGVITGEIERPRVCYSLNPGSLMPLSNLLNAIFEKDRRDDLRGAICCPSSVEISPSSCCGSSGVGSTAEESGCC